MSSQPITLYTTPSETLYNGPFWDHLHTVSKLNPEDTLIIVSSYKLKELIEKKLADTVSENSLLPLCLTLDELVQNHRGIPLEDTPTLDTILFNSSLNNNPPLPPNVNITSGLKDRLCDTLLKTFTYTSPKNKLSNNPWLPTINHLQNTFKKTCKVHHITRKPDAYQEVASHPSLPQKLKKKGCFILGFWQCPNYQWPLFEALLTHCDASAILLPFVEHDTHYKGIIPFINRLRRFSTNHTIFPNPSPLPKKTPPQWITPQTPEEECEWICQDIRKKLQQNPTLTEGDFTLICSNINHYTPILHRYLSAYNIPCQTSLKQQLYQHPLYRCLTALFNWIETPDTHHLLRLLATSTLTDIHDPHRKERIPIHSLFFKMLNENYGPQKTLESLKNSTILHINHLQNGARSPDTSRIELDASIAIAHSQIKLLDFFIELRNTFQKINTPDAILEHLHTTLLRFSASQNTLDILMKEALKISQHFTLIESTKQPKLFYTFLLKELGKKTIPLTQPCHNGIHIIGKFESFCYPHKHTYILDCTTRNWPKVGAENLFFSKKELAQLNWPNQTTYHDWDELLFFSSLKQADVVTLTTPKTYSSTATLPSPFIAKIRQDFLGIFFPQSPTLDTHSLPHKTYLQAIGMLSRSHPNHLPDLTQHHPLWSTLNTQLKTPFSYAFSLSPSDRLLSQSKHHIHTTKFSPTRLEKYQNCPTAYYFQYILKERPTEAITDDISQALWGQFLHTLLQKIGEKMKHKKLQFSCQAHHNAIRELALNLTQKELRQQTQNRFFWNQKKQLLIGTQQTKGLIEAWLHCEFNDDSPLKPGLFEKTLFTTLPHTELGAIHLKGTLDVILEDHHSRWIAVQDYKTGKTLPTGSDVLSLYNLQLPIYQWLLQKEYPKKTLAGSFVVQLNSPHTVAKKCITTTPDAKKHLLSLGNKRPKQLPDNFRHQLENHLSQLFSKLNNGQFSPNLPHHPERSLSKRTDMCRYCSYWPTCHYEKRFTK